MSTPLPTPPPAGRQLALFAAVLLVFGGALLLGVLRYRGPAPAGEEAPLDAFSAARAWRHVVAVVGDGEPRPVGSPAGARALDAIRAELEALGLATEVQDTLAWGEGVRVCRVRNLLATIPGTEGGPAVLLACHYDTERCAPGAVDDGLAVAAMLELARALRAGPPLRRDVVLLFDEGEESGLFGARAFAREHPRADDVLAVVNLEARGTRGASIFFESSPGNDWLADLFAAHVTYPVASSLAHRVYREMPNDTDLTVFMEHGMAGVNFACIGGYEDYHTPGDDLAAASRRTLQHHGDNALAMTRALGALDGPPAEAADTVFFDVLGRRTLGWPVGASVPLALASLLALAAAGVALTRRRLLDGRDLALALPLSLVVLAGALAGGLLAGAVLGEGGRGWPASAWAAWSGLAGGALVGAVLVAWAARALASPWALWLGGWAAWSVLALVAAVLAPDACYPLVAPALVAGPSGLLAAALAGGVRRHPGALAVLPPVLVAAALWTPLLHMLHLALGLASPLVAVGPVALLAWSAQAALPPGVGPRQREHLALPVFVLVLGLVATGARPYHTPEMPQRHWLALHVDEDADEARWVSVTGGGGELDAWHAEHAFAEETARAFPFGEWYESARHAPAPAPDLAAPAVEVLSREPVSDVEDVWRVRVRVRSRRGAALVGVQVRERNAHIATVDGVAPEDGFGWLARHLTAPEEGFELELLTGADPAQLDVWDRTDGLPYLAQPLLDTLPDTARESWDGHRTVVSRVVELDG